MDLKFVIIIIPLLYINIPLKITYKLIRIFYLIGKEQNHIIDINFNIIALKNY